MGDHSGDHAARRGVLTIAPPGDDLGPGTKALDFARTGSGLAASLHVAGGESVFTLSEAAIAGARFHARIRFVWDDLRRVELVMTASPDGRRWPEWTHDGELSRKAAHEAWAGAVFGRAMPIRPVLAPEPVMPAAPGPEHPRHIRFDWGEVVSWYDGKAGAASLMVFYGAGTEAEQRRGAPGVW
jgi:hypothetical protein